MHKCESHIVCLAAKERGTASFFALGEKHTRLFHQLAYLPPRLSPTWSFHQNILGSDHGKTKHPFSNRFFINVTVQH